MSQDELHARTLRVLADALAAIERGDFEGDLRFAATALGYLVAGCVDAAAQATCQLLTGIHIGPPAVPATPAQLREAIGKMIPRSTWAPGKP